MYTELKEYLKKNPKLNGRSLSKHPEFKTKLMELTSFLDECYDVVPISIRLGCVENGCFKVPLCEFCNERPATIKRKIFGRFCSDTCSQKGTVEERKKRYREKTGYDHHMHNPEVLDTIKKTNLSRYGVEHYFQSESFANNLKETSLKRYGTEHPSMSKEVIENRKLTVKDRYGVDNVYQSEDVKKKIKETMLSRYGVSSPQQSEDIRQKTIETNVQVYGHSSPMQNDIVKEKVRTTNISKYGFPCHTQSHYSEEYVKLSQDKELLLKEYERLGSSRGLAQEYGIGSHTTILNLLHYHGIEVEGNVNTYPEKRVQDILNDLGVEFVVGDRTLIRPKEIDILVPDHLLAIEVNGIYYHSTKFKERKYHQDKSLSIIESGYRPFHIYEDQVYDDRCLNIIKSKLSYYTNNVNSRVYARKCEVELDVVPTDYSELYNNHHIQGSIRSSINIGLRHNDALVACISFSKTKEDGVYMLTRYCTSTTVVGGFAKLLNVFKKTFKWTSIITYASLDYSDGRVYRNNNFDLVGITDPNYFYVDSAKKRYSRQTFMKSKLEDRLDVYEPSLTESQLMSLNGYIKIHDSGSLKFRLDNK